MGTLEVVLLVVVIVGAIVAFFGWDRYRGNQKSATNDASQPTNEVFIDTESGRRMRVWYNQTTGQRQYRPE